MSREVYEGIIFVLQLITALGFYFSFALWLVAMKKGETYFHKFIDFENKVFRDTDVLFSKTDFWLVSNSRKFFNLYLYFYLTNTILALIK